MSDYLVIDNLTKSYPTPREPAVIVQDFNLHIKKGEFVCLIGHSGCGKSTVLSMVAGLSDLTSGAMILAGRELIGPGPDRGIVFQSPCLLPWLTAYENVLLGVNQVFFTASKLERQQIVEYYLSVVGLADSMHKRPGQLSQGMRQRVRCVCPWTLVCHPPPPPPQWHPTVMCHNEGANYSGWTGCHEGSQPCPAQAHTCYENGGITHTP